MCLLFTINQTSNQTDFKQGFELFHWHFSCCHHQPLRAFIQPHPAMLAQQDPERPAEHLGTKHTAHCPAQLHFPVGLSSLFLGIPNIWTSIQNYICGNPLVKKTELADQWLVFTWCKESGCVSAVHCLPYIRDGFGAAVMEWHRKEDVIPALGGSNRWYLC